MPRTGHRGQRSEAAQNRRVVRGAGLRRAGANLTQVERDAVNRLIARDLARIDGDGDADGTLHSAEEDIAKTKAENNELKARINTLQAGTSGGSSTVDTKLLSNPQSSKAKRRTGPGSH